jgi:hypothetical protein
MEASTPTYSLTTCSNNRHYNSFGFNLEFSNELEECGFAYLRYSSANSNHFWSQTTLKFFQELTPSSLLNVRSSLCYDVSQYFCLSSECLPPTDTSLDSSNGDLCSTQFNGFGASCPQNATCADGKYTCDPGFKDTFYLEYYIDDPNDCTACHLPRGCVPDEDVPPGTIIEVYYNISNSFSNTNQFVNISLGKVDRYTYVIADGCSDDQFGDQYIDVGFRHGDNNEYFWVEDSNDDKKEPNLCSTATKDHRRFHSDEHFEFQHFVRLGCFGSSQCGGTVKVIVGEPCPKGQYSSTGVAPCTPCPTGHYSDFAATSCTLCATGYVGFNRTAPCTACPPGTVESKHESCVDCDPQTLQTMGNHEYRQCATQLIENMVTTEMFETMSTKVDTLVSAFEQYLVDTKYGMPTVPPTPMPTRRRRSCAPTNN